MSIPSFNKFLFLILEQMLNGKSYRRNSNELRDPIRKKAKEFYGVTEEDMKEELKTGGSRFEDRIGWAFTFLIKAEYIEKDVNQKFTYKITKLGIEAFNDVTKNGKILDEKYLKDNSPNYIKNWTPKPKSNSLELDDKDEDVEISENSSKTTAQMEQIQDEITEDVKIQFRETIRNIKWEAFEDFCQDLIVKMGYGVGKLREKRQRDGGIDGEIDADYFGFSKFLIQAKKYAENTTVGAPAVYQFSGTVGQHAKGILITTSTFTEDAKNAAKTNPNIRLVDINELFNLSLEYQVGIKKITFEVPELDL